MTNQVSAGISRKFNIGNYENIDVHASVTLDVPDGSAVEDIFVHAWARVQNEVDEKEAQIKRLRAEQPKAK